MPRNYDKEYEWRKMKYKRLECFLETEMVEAFKAKLKEEKVQYATWLRDRINEYMNK